MEMLDNLLNNFALISKIGEGSFSEVMKVKDKKTGKFYAAKRLTKHYVTVDEVTNCAELKTLQKLEYHPNVLSLVEFVYEPKNGALTLIFDLMDMSMYDFIKNRKKTLSETRCKHFLFQLTLGLNHLHRSGIFHRDIKPENILIRMDPRLKNNNPLRSELVQLADLGSVCSSDLAAPHSAYISTRWYRAPECLLTSGFYGPKMDIWALGCVFYEVLTYTPLFPGDNELDQLHKIHEIIGTPNSKLLARFKHCNVDYDFPKKKPMGFHNMVPMLSEYGVDVLKKTLVYHPDIRISARKLLEHIYFDDIRNKSRLASTANRFLSTSHNGEKAQSWGKVNKDTKSLNSSRGSVASDFSGRSATVRKLHAAQEKINKQLERGWGMNACPVKAKILSDIKSSVHNSRKISQA
jgi:renal tumor antigen